MHDPNIELLERAATLLSPLLDDLVFVGGCITGLLISDPAAGHIRSTFDVDALVEISSYGEYHDFSNKLRALGLTEDNSEKAPICRWKAGDLKIDVMPTDEKILGFSNQWYSEAITHAQPVTLSSGATIRTITAPYFVATKIGAFLGRGNGDFFGSHDIEDLVAVIDGREELLSEMSDASKALRQYVGAWMAETLDDGSFREALPGQLAPDRGSQNRLPLLAERMKRLASLVTSA